MDKYEKRRLGLLRLRDAECNGNSAELARRIGRDPTYVARMLYPEGKAGRKRISGDMAGVIETAFHLPRGGLEGDITPNRPVYDVPSALIPLMSVAVNVPAHVLQDFVTLMRHYVVMEGAMQRGNIEGEVLDVGHAEHDISTAVNVGGENVSGDKLRGKKRTIKKAS